MTCHDVTAVMVTRVHICVVLCFKFFVLIPNTVKNDRYNSHTLKFVKMLNNF